jgi:hypothetical protein
MKVMKKNDVFLILIVLFTGVLVERHVSGSCKSLIVSAKESRMLESKLFLGLHKISSAELAPRIKGEP